MGEQTSYLFLKNQHPFITIFLSQTLLSTTGTRTAFTSAFPVKQEANTQFIRTLIKMLRNGLFPTNKHTNTSSQSPWNTELLGYPDGLEVVRTAQITFYLFELTLSNGNTLLGVQ